MCVTKAPVEEVRRCCVEQKSDYHICMCQQMSANTFQGWRATGAAAVSAAVLTRLRSIGTCGCHSIRVTTTARLGNVVCVNGLLLRTVSAICLLELIVGPVLVIFCQHFMTRVGVCKCFVLM